MPRPPYERNFPQVLGRSGNVGTTKVLPAIDRLRPVRPPAVNLGKIGRYYQPDSITLPRNTPEEVTWMPPDGGNLYQTTVRVWCEGGAPDGSTLTLAFDPQTAGRDRGVITADARIVGGATDTSFAVGDYGLTASGVLATAIFGWESLGTPDDIEFFLEFISTPL